MTPLDRFFFLNFVFDGLIKILIGAIPLCCNIVTIYYVNNTTYINQQLLKVKILATCFSYSEPSSGTLWDPISFTFYIIGHM